MADKKICAGFVYEQYKGLSKRFNDNLPIELQNSFHFKKYNSKFKKYMYDKKKLLAKKIL